MKLASCLYPRNYDAALETSMALVSLAISPNLNHFCWNKLSAFILVELAPLESNDETNEFLVSWDGTNIFNQANLDATTGWTNLQFLVTATKTNTVLQLGFYDDFTYDPNENCYVYLGLDDIRCSTSFR